MRAAFVLAIAPVACGVDDVDAFRATPANDGAPPPTTAIDAGTPGSGALADAAAPCVAADPLGPPGGYVPPSYAVACGARDPFAWPFSKNSIWNLPIGGGAAYVDAHLGTLGGFMVIADLVYREAASDPLVEVIRPDHQHGVDGQGGTGRYIRLPPSFVYPPSPNNGASFLGSEGHTLQEFAAFTCASPGSTSLGWDYGGNQITDPAPNGGCGGSGLSVLGGTLRPGELTSPAPLHHALKVGLDWALLSPDWPGRFRWPARQSDGFGNNGYSGALNALTMGSLVALRPDVDVDALPWRTPLGPKIARALQDYGAYVVQSSGANALGSNGGYGLALSAQNETIAEVKTAYGVDWSSGGNGGGPDWLADVQAIYERLAVIDNNAETAPGGGGVPRRALAPDFVPFTLDAGLTADAGR